MYQLSMYLNILRVWLYLEDLVGPEDVAALELVDAALVVVLKLFVRVHLSKQFE